MDINLLSPMLAFTVILIAVGLISLFLSKLAFRNGPKHERSSPPYACGEDVPGHDIQPNYGQFLPYAYFFTILHVVALMATTMPIFPKVMSGVGVAAAIVIALIYILGALIGLTVLYGGK